jgi:AGCS family alanine or glycine:cation symporter
VPSVFKEIFKDAFSISAISGGGLGFLVSNALRYGTIRGLFSNEAGCGTAPIAHATSNTDSPCEQGFLGIIEVFIDTILMCSLTAIVMLVATNYNQHNLFGAELSAEAYSAAGLVGKGGIGILTAVFAFMSLIGCSFYGEKSFEYLFGKKYIVFYRILYIALAFVGGINSPKLIWSFADICNGLMALPNLFAINCLAKEVIYPKVKKSLKTN